MTRSARRLALWMGSWVAAAVILALVSRGLDWHAARASLTGARLPWLAAALAANFAILLLWAGLWKLLVPRAAPVRYGRMFEIVATASAIMNTIPALVGHAAALVLLVRRGHLAARTAGAVMTLDQVGEGVGKLVVLSAAAWLLGVPDWVNEAGRTLAPLVIALACAVALVARFGGTFTGAMRIARVLDAVRTDMHVLRSPRRLAGAIGLALLMKGAEAAAIASIFLALGIDLPSSAAFVVLGAVNVATMLPVTPGNIGTYEAGAFAAYRWLGVSPDAALAAAVVQHACFMIPAVGSGLLLVAATGTTAMREALSSTPARAAGSPAGRSAA